MYRGGLSDFGCNWQPARSQIVWEAKFPHVKADRLLIWKQLFLPKKYSMVIWDAKLGQSYWKELIAFAIATATSSSCAG